MRHRTIKESIYLKSIDWIPTIWQALLSVLYIILNWEKLKAFSLKSAAAAAKSLQSCPTLCDPIDSSPPGSAVPGILQARTLEWVAISFSNAWKWKVTVKSVSHVQLSATPWTVAHQAPPSMGFSRQEYWSGVPLPSPSVLFNGSQFPLKYIDPNVCFDCLLMLSFFLH